MVARCIGLGYTWCGACEESRGCLLVHDQIVAMEGRFNLTGTPRYADWMSNSPFHGGCRTVPVLYVPEIESMGISTGEMQDAVSGR